MGMSKMPGRKEFEAPMPRVIDLQPLTMSQPLALTVSSTRRNPPKGSAPAPKDQTQHRSWTAIPEF